jgi:hypothetical protein
MLAYFLGFAIVFSLVILFISFYVRRIADLALTDQFRAAEHIANGHMPEKWIVQINRRLTHKRLLPIPQPEASGTDLVLHKIDQLVRFFDKSPFFENAEAHQMLLAQLRETREHWAAMTWQEIMSEYGAIARSTANQE